MKLNYPNGKQFAFTFCDDTDFATLENVKPVYDFLFDLGMRTTKLVWLRDGDANGRNNGDTCEKAEYLEWLRSLQEKGFEIGLHNVAASSSTREQIENGIREFTTHFGGAPRVHCNHTGCLDNLYWGSFRMSGWRRAIYNLWTRGKNKRISLGHIPANQHFWGDICREKIEYVRNFTCDSLNTFKFCPQMPYHDGNKPFVNFWFAATNASSPKYFRQNFDFEQIDRLIEENGLCIAYVHFGTKFYKDGKLDEHFKNVMEYVAAKNGWFAPVSEIMNFLRAGASIEDRRISNFELQKLEMRWLFGKFGKKVGI